MTTELDTLDQQIAALLERRIALLAPDDARPLDDQLAAGPPAPHEALSAPLWRALVYATTAAANQATAPPPSHPPRRITIVGGHGAMARLLTNVLTRHAHTVTPLDRNDWPEAPSLLASADLVLIATPIDTTEQAIRDAAPHIRPDAVLADVTSIKSGPVAAMLESHPGPVLGLHPMFGPHVHGLAAQRIVVCRARGANTDFDWLLDLFRAEGATLVDSTPDEHDRMMVAVQAIRHFTTFALGVYLTEQGLDVARSLDFASPIYRLEIDVVSRLFAQSPDLYLSIISASDDRREAIVELARTVSRLAEALRSGNLDSLRESFEAASAALGPEAPRALEETMLAVDALSTALMARRHV